MWIKICGNTTREDALLAAACGADAVGFVFAPSPRRVTPRRVSRITPYLPDNVDKFGVFVDPGFEEIASTVEECGLTGVQLHSDMDVAFRLRERFDREGRCAPEYSSRTALWRPIGGSARRHAAGSWNRCRTCRFKNGQGRWRNRSAVRLAACGIQLFHRRLASAPDCGGWIEAGECCRGYLHDATMGSGRGERCGKRARTQGSGASEGFHSAGTTGGSRVEKDEAARRSLAGISGETNVIACN